MQNTWPKTFVASILDLSRVHVLHHVQSHVIPTYTLRSIHVTEFRVSSISAPNSAERSRYAKYTEIGMALHGHERGDRGHAIRYDLNEKMVVQLNVIDPFISFRWLVTIREENRRPAHEHIERNVSPFVPFLDVWRVCSIADAQPPHAESACTEIVTLHGNLRSPISSSGWNMLFVDDRCRSRIHEWN